MHIRAGLMLAILFLCGLSSAADAPRLAEAPELTDAPEAGHAIRDNVALFSAEDAEKTEARCSELLVEKKIPVAVLTIRSVSLYGSGSIETLAAKFLENWAKTDASRPWNEGALILVAKDDRKVRIQMGLSHQHTKDGLCNQIMQTRIIPQFKAGAFSAGMRDGTEALVALLRDGTMPPVSNPIPRTYVPAAPRTKSEKEISPGWLVIYILVGVPACFLGFIGLMLYLTGGFKRGSSGYSSTSSSNDNSWSSSSSSDSSSSSSSSSSDGGGSTGSW